MARHAREKPFGWAGALIVVVASCSSHVLVEKDGAQDLRDAGSEGGDGRAQPSEASPREIDCQGTCTFGASYTVRTDGFFAAQTDCLRLSPPQSAVHVGGSYVDGGFRSLECSPELPACGQGIGACDIAQDLADPDVVDALAETPIPFFGEDNRGHDGNAFQFLRNDDHGFEVGADCVHAGCRPTPPGVRRLVDDLYALDVALIATPECRALGAQLSPAGHYNLF